MIEQESLEPPLFIRHQLELIVSSNGSIHTFMAALVLAVESLAIELNNIYQLKGADTSELKKHLKKWDGDQNLKDRAIGLIGCLDHASAKSILKKNGRSWRY